MLVTTVRPVNDTTPYETPEPTTEGFSGSTSIQQSDQTSTRLIFTTGNMAQSSTGETTGSLATSVNTEGASTTQMQGSSPGQTTDHQDEATTIGGATEERTKRESETSTKESTTASAVSEGTLKGAKPKY